LTNVYIVFNYMLSHMHAYLGVGCTRSTAVEISLFLYEFIVIYSLSLRLCLCVTVPSLIRAPVLVKVMSPSTAILHLYPVSSSWQHAPVSSYYVIVVPANWQLLPDDLELEQVEKCSLLFTDWFEKQDRKLL